MTMSPNKLAVLTVFALLGSVSCQGPTYPPPALSPSTPPPVYPPPPAMPQPAACPPPSATPMHTPTPPPIYSSPSPSPPTFAPAPTPVPTYPPPPTPMSPPPISSPPTSAPVPTPVPANPPPPPPTSPPPTPAPVPTPAPPPTPTSPPPTPTSPPPSPSPPTPTPPPPPSPGTQLMVGYYTNKCNNASVDVEAIVKKYVNATDAGMQAGLVRLFFHDCFVRGCDASILIDTWTNDTSLTPEKFGVPNFPSLRGFEVIDAAKTEIEAACPGTVSCADIVAFAARDASYFLSGGNVKFTMPAGRYDGNVSLASETLPNLPPPFANFTQLVQMFAGKGLDVTDMITLSGAHSIGRAHCSSFIGTGLPPSNFSNMDPAYVAMLQANCTSANGSDNTVMQDFQTSNVLDNQYYKNVLAKKVLFTSDAALTTNSSSTSPSYNFNLVRAYADINPFLWNNKFGKAMVKMGTVEVKTAATGEIRTNCRKVNGRP